MNLFWRRLLTALLFFVLVIVGPALLFYGAGYRLNVKEKRIERAGLLYVTTEPENATMVIDGNTYSTGKELVLTGLLPGEYDIAINKEGYHTWFKRLQIVGGQTTFIRDLQLIHNLPPRQVAEINTEESIVASFDPYLFTLHNNRFKMINYLTEATEIFSLPNSFPIVFFQRVADDTFLFSQNTSWFLLDKNELKKLDLTIDAVVKQAKYRNGMLYLLTSKGLSKMNLEDSTPNLVLTMPNLHDFLATDSGYWLLASDMSERNMFLYRFYEGERQPELVYTTAYAPGLHLEDAYKNFLTLFDQEQNTLYLADGNQMPASIETIDHVAAWEWSSDHEQLLLAAPFELSILHFEDSGKQELLLRLSSEFTDAAWDKEEQHVFYVAEHTLKMVERDDRNQRNIYSLSQSSNNLEVISVAESGEELYVLADKKDLLKIPLR